VSRQVCIVAPPPLAADAPRPLVTVIIPTRNPAHLLLRSINSVLAQTNEAHELIVVNDGSTDTTRALLDGLRDPRLRVIHREQQRSSAAAARNVALREVRGSLVAFHDDDDVWLPEKLARQVAALNAAPDAVGLCLCGRLVVQSQAPRARYLGGPALVQQIDFSRGLGNGGPDYALVATPGWLVRREALQRAGGGFDERIRSWDDWELALRLWLATDFVVVDEPLYVQDHVAGGGLIRLERARADDLALIEQLHGSLWADDRAVRARHAYARGIALSLHEPRPAGRAELWQALRLRPLAPKAWIAWLLTFVPAAVGLALTQKLRALLGRLWLLRNP
jgi:glycosyltransferase involved in cell wall biosynthesis